MKCRFEVLATGVFILSFAHAALGQSDTSVVPDANLQKTAQQVERGRGGSRDDVGAIGNRKVDGGRFGNWYSQEKEIALGQKYAHAVDSKLKLISDPLINEYVTRVAQNLSINSDARVPFTIKVFEDSSDVNAFSLPGGFLYVPTGLILTVDSEAELAAVFAHEIAHVAARHGTRELTRVKQVEFGTLFLGVATGPLGYAVRAAAAFALPMSSSRTSKHYELEADYLGVQYMYKAGYDPEAFVSFFERIGALQDKASRLKKAFTQYPTTADRIHKVQAEIAAILPGREEYVVSTSDFEDVKARLSDSRSDHPVLRKKQNNGPVLRKPQTISLDSQ